MAAPLPLGVLDQTPVSEGETGGDALHHTVQLAQRCDALGYKRYWLAEHHGGIMLSGPSPEALIGPIALSTSRIRVGSGGVMLPHYSPLKVAETFSVLGGLVGPRVDLGIGRAPGSDPMTAYALQRDRRDAAPDDFPNQLAELLAWLRRELPSDHPFAPLARSLPGDPSAVAPWLLGSSPQSAIWAAELGLPYAFADFINPEGASIAALYRERFKAGEWGEGPRVVVAVSAVCAESDSEAERLASSGRMAFAMLREGRPIAIPSVEKAERFLSSREKTGKPTARRRAAIGSPATVRAQLSEIVEAYQADEAMIVTITHSHEARVRSYELIAEEFGLGSDPTPGST